MSETISVKDKVKADTAIKEFGPEQEAIRKVGTDAKSDWDALAKLFLIEVDGETCGETLPPEPGDLFVTRTEAIALQVGGLASSWTGWVKSLTVVQEEGKTEVEKAGEGETPKERPGDRPVGTTPTPNNVWLQPVSPEPEPEKPTAANPGIKAPPAFTMK